jgi:hypothetical protein
MRRTFPSLLWNPSPPETKPRQVCTSDLVIKALLALLPDFLAQRQSEFRESRESHIRVKSMNAAQQTIKCRLNALEAGQREFSVQHSSIEAELSEMRESADRTERELSEFATEIGRVSSTSATAREILSLRADEADERCTRNERGSVGLSAEVEVLRKRSHEAHEKIAAHKDDISKIKKDLKQLKDRVDQQPPISTPPTPTPTPPASTPPASTPPTPIPPAPRHAHGRTAHCRHRKRREDSEHGIER